MAGRTFKPAGGGSQAVSFAAIFGETDPMEITSTPRPVGVVPAKGQPVSTSPLTVANGWINRPNQTKGMSVLYVDQLNQQPLPNMSGHTRSAINESSYAPIVHYRGAHWLFAGWDPVYRFANTAMDMRFSVGRRPNQTGTANTPAVVPGTATMGPYAVPFTQAWRVPRFSTEPNTIIPQSGK